MKALFWKRDCSDGLGISCKLFVDMALFGYAGM